MVLSLVVLWFGQQIFSLSICVHFSQSLKRESLRERAGVDTNIAGVGGTGTRRLRERVVLVRNSAGAGLRKPSRAGLYIIAPKNTN